MADEKNSNGIEISYRLKEGCRERIPIVELKLLTPYREYPKNWLEVILDTGYDGGLLIPLEDYRAAELQKSELPIEQWDIGESLTGEMTLLQAAIANIHIRNLETHHELRIETFQGNQEFILGLNGIRQIFLCLDGPNQLMKIWT